MLRRWMAIILSVTMVFTLVPTSTYAETSTFSDMPDDWSTAALESAVDNGLLKGSNGKIMPQENLTRAQMATVINRAFGSYVTDSLDGFTDVSREEWYYSEMAKAVAMGTFQGSENNLDPNDPITREQAFAVIARALNLGSSTVAPAGFSDLSDLSSWATGEVYSLINNGYIQGADGKLNPQGYITRAEFAQVMDNIIKEYVRMPGEYTLDVVGNVMITMPGVTLSDSTITGDLIIGDGVFEGDATLDNVEVTGRLLVRGGGTDSISITGGSVIDSITVAKVNGAVRVYAEDGTEIGEVVVDGKDDVILEGIFADIAILSDDITVWATNATIDTLTVEGDDSSLVIGEGSTVEKLVLKGVGTEVEVSGIVAQILVEESAEDTLITVDEDGEVEEIIVNSAGTLIEGEGKVEDVQANADDVVVETEGTKVSAAEGTEGVMAGDTEVKPGKSTEVKDNTPQSSGSRSDEVLDNVVNFADKEFEKMLKHKLQKTTIRKSDIESIEELVVLGDRIIIDPPDEWEYYLYQGEMEPGNIYFYGYGVDNEGYGDSPGKISTMEDIPKFTKLKSLKMIFQENVSFQNITQYLSRIEDLDISGNSLDDISFLSNMTDLRTLSISGNFIEDISPLESLTRVERLDISSNFITNLDALSNMNSLKEINMWRNKITSIEGLENLIELTKIDMRSNYINDISSISNLSKLIYLDGSYNEIYDMDSISELTKLVYLDLLGQRQNSSGGEKIEISSSAFLANLENLERLSIEFGEEVVNLDWIINNPLIEDLYIEGDGIVDITSISTLENLEQLYLGLKNNTDYNDIGSLVKLKVLSVYSDYIEDVSFLDGLSNLQSINLASWKGGDFNSIYLKNKDLLANVYLTGFDDYLNIEEIGNLKTIKTIDIRYNNIRNYSTIDLMFLENLNNLTSLQIDADEIHGFKKIESLIDLRFMSLRGKIINSGFEPLKGLINLENISFYNAEFTAEHVNNSITNEVFKDLNKLRNLSLMFGSVPSSIDEEQLMNELPEGCSLEIYEPYEEDQQMDDELTISGTFPIDGQQDYYPIYTYLNLVFSEEMRDLTSRELGRIELTSVGGEEALISEVAAGTNDKTNILIIVNDSLELDTVYTLFIPANTIKSMNEIPFEEDIQIIFKTAHTVLKGKVTSDSDINGSKLELIDGEGTAIAEKTLTDGGYRFVNMDGGEYILKVTMDNGDIFTKEINVLAQQLNQIDMNIVPEITISVTPSSITIETGETLSVEHTLTNSDGTGAEIVWTTSDASIATVDSNGLIQAISTGEVVITATLSTDDNIYANCNVTVVPAGNNYTVTTDGGIKVVEADEALYEAESTLWAPLRFIAEAFIWEVYWDNEGTATLVDGSKSVEVSLDSGYLVINQDRSFCDLEYVSQALGYDLSWDLDTKSISLMKQ